MKHTAFDRYHPLVQAAYFAAVVVFCMAAMQPAYLGITLIAAFAYSVFLRGLGAALRSALWQVPLMVIVCLVNPLFSAAGSTELFKIGPRAVYAESLFFGACMGAMLVAMMLWLSNASRVMSFDKTVSLMGNAAPAVGLVLSMAMRLVPAFVRRGAQIDSVQRVCMTETSQGRGVRENLASRTRLATVLMSWAMEDSIETSDAMRARGWGSGNARSTYSRYRFRSRDGCALVMLGILVGLNAVLAFVACGQFSFYPKTSTLVFWWGYLVYVPLVFAPLIAELLESIRWAAR